MRKSIRCLSVAFVIFGVSAIADTAEAGRWKLDSNGGCYWDANDSGPNQCNPPPTGRWKWTGTTCYWDGNDSGPDQCDPYAPGGPFYVQWYNLNFVVRDVFTNAGICNSDIVISIDWGNGTRRSTDCAGFANYGVQAGAISYTVSAAGYDAVSGSVNVGSSTTLYLSLTPVEEHVVGTEAGRVVPQGPVFRREDGSIFQWRGVTAFALLEAFLNGEHGKVEKFLHTYIALGANTFRVFGMWCAPPSPGAACTKDFRIEKYAHAVYHAGLSTFAELLAAHGARFEYTAITDGANLIPAPADQWAHLVSASQSLEGWWNWFLEIANEPFKNGVDVERLGRAPTSAPQASGVYDYFDTGQLDGLFQLDYITVHLPRDGEWPRKTRLDEYFRIYRRPVVGDEPMGAADISIPGRRSNVPEDFYDLGAGCALHGAGCTFHCESCMRADPPSPIEQAAVRMFFDAMLAVPPEAPTWQYSRGGLASSPLEHSDAHALRTFCQITTTQAVCEVVRPTSGWQAVARNGWRITRQAGPNGRLVFLER